MAAPSRSDSVRFAFGENWQSFARAVDDTRIAEACGSLQSMLGLTSMESLSFLDVGSGSGLFSLAAVMLGARRVHSFDFDHSSVDSTRELRRRYTPDAEHWTIEQGSVLDLTYLRSLGEFDIVYAWGVLHHTGDMMHALDNVAAAVAPEGRLFLSIYNDQGLRSHIWRRIKRLYNALPRSFRAPYVAIVMFPAELYALAAACLHLRPHAYVQRWTEYKRRRGMSRWHDLVDWVGGYPFEVATPETVFRFFHSRGFTLTELTTCGGRLGCNQFVFVRSPAAVNHSSARHI